ncbi:xanthine/uracil permease [Anaeramoeba flamelloides]|uniref:Xanthine/uracil permease n=1 Tax=Anaeramoeba flamelloides TaxID=1746091 RepID=A0AAV8AG19_9EUKA|nr:xanthine/uracil permease [Anaeramoeba flamelloides]KAJ6249386.1 xanthine/uracil permease [Anaeramoeba flamelloides]
MSSQINHPLRNEKEITEITSTSNTSYSNLSSSSDSFLIPLSATSTNRGARNFSRNKFSRFLGYVDEKYQISLRGSTFTCEILGGILMFLCSLYTLRLQPMDLVNDDLDLSTCVTTASLLTGLATVSMSVANFPIVLSVSLTGSTFFKNVLMKQYKYDYSTSCTIILLASLASFALPFLLRKNFLKSIPAKFRIGIGFGIGLLIGRIAFQYMFGNSDQIISKTSFNRVDVVVSMLVSSFTLLLIIYLLLRWRYRENYASINNTYLSYLNSLSTPLSNTQKRNSFLSGSNGIVIAYAIPTVLSLIAILVINLARKKLVIRDWYFPSLKKIAFKKNFNGLDRDCWFLVPLISANQFCDSVATVLIIIQMAFLDEIEYDQSKFISVLNKGSFSKFQMIVFATVVWSIISSIFGSTMIVPLIESITGLVVGCRTGLSTLVTGICFFIVLFCPPIIDLVQPVSTAPLLLLTCVISMSMIKNLQYKNIQEIIPYVATLLVIPLSSSISFGSIYGYSFFFLFLLFAPNSGYKKITKSMILIFVFCIATICFQYVSGS